PLEQAVEPLADSEFETLQREIDRVSLVLGADLPLAAPLEAVLVHMAVDQIAVHIRRSAEGGVRAPHEYGLHLQHERALQVRDEVGCTGWQAPERTVEVRISGDFDREAGVGGRRPDTDKWGGALGKNAFPRIE